MRALGRALALAALAGFACAGPDSAPGAAPAGLAGPTIERDGRVVWPRATAGPRPRALEALRGRLAASGSAAESLAAWDSASGDSLLRPVALRQVARLHLVLGDTVSADRTLAGLAGTRSIWQWEAARARSSLALAAGDTARADSLLERSERRDWPETDRAEWLVRRIELRLALGDTASAIAFAGQMLAGYPALSQASGALRTLEALRASQGESLPVADEERAAESERLRGRNESALARWGRVVRLKPGVRAHLKRADLLGDLGRYDEARRAATAALAAARTASDSVDARISRAWDLRQMGRETAALADYAAAIRVSGRFTAARWARARFREERGAWIAARDDYARVAAGGGERADDAALRAGLMSLAAGETGEALRWFERGGSDASRFWRGVTLRRSRRATGDSVLAALAALPGYSFYRSAARDTLGVRGRPREPVPVPDAPEEPGVQLARALDDLGRGEEAGLVLERWAARDERVARAPGRERSTGAWLAAARVSYRAGRMRQAIRLAQRALSDLPDQPEAHEWSVWPCVYPPAYDSLFAAYPESAAGGIERSLLQAVAWKESRFDPVARSRADAVGLFQLKRAAVIDVAGWLREQAPTDAALADPGLNLRYGSRYLERLLERFGGDLPQALAAYNAGPTAAQRWTRLRDLGGDALACEEIDYPETQDYVKTILAVRQAYRELRPTQVR